LLLSASLIAAVFALLPALREHTTSHALAIKVTPIILLTAYTGLALFCGSLWRLPPWHLVALGGLAFVGAGWLGVALAPALSLRCLAMTVPAALVWICWQNPWPTLVGLPLAGWAQVCLGRRRPAHVALGILLGGLLAFSLLILLVGG
jgi:hypothetical protein